MKRVIVMVLLIAVFAFSLASCVVHDDAKSSLTNAVVLSHPEKVQSLLASGAKVDAANEAGMQAIHIFTLNGNRDSTEVLKMLLNAGAKADAVDKQGNQPIIFAVQTEKVEAVKILLAAGAKVNTVDKNGLQLIHLVTNTSSTEMIKVLLAAGALIDAPDNNGDRPLHWASRHGNADMVKALLAAGADPDAADRDGDQPLHWAARYGNYGNNEMIKALLAAGAKEYTPNKKGDQPINIAKKIGPTKTDSGNKGILDEASINYIQHTIYPILIKAKICTSETRDCIVGEPILCYQSSSLSCDVYGISDENIVKEITLSMQNSGLRIGRVTFWRSTHNRKSVFEKPFSQFDGHA